MTASAGTRAEVGKGEVERGEGNRWVGKEGKREAERVRNRNGRGLVPPR